MKSKAVTEENINAKQKETGGNTAKRTKLGEIKRNGKKYWPYYIMFIPCLVFLILFNYIPMGGIVLAFKEYWPRLGIYASPWAQPLMKNFAKLVENPEFWNAFTNTLILFFINMVTGFPFTIICALLFNELRSPVYAKVVQTILFIPYFISWVVMSGIIKMVFSIDGLVNTFITDLGGQPVGFLTQSGPFLALLVLSGIFKNSGYSMVIYLAAITGVDQDLYEAVDIDGGNRLHKMIHVTLPGIRHAIVIQIVLSLAGVLNGGLDQIYNLYSPQVYDVAEVIDTYIFRTGFQDVENGTALGLFKSLIGLVLTLGANWAAKKLGGEGIW